MGAIWEFRIFLTHIDRKRGCYSAEIVIDTTASKVWNRFDASWSYSGREFPGETSVIRNSHSFTERVKSSDQPSSPHVAAIARVDRRSRIAERIPLRGSGGERDVAI